MAGSVRAVFRFNTNWINNVFMRNTFLNVIGCRTLYSPRSLGMTGYETARTNIHVQFANVEDTFREKMKNICEDDGSMVFTEDLKAMLHLIEKNPEDSDLLFKMMLKFNKQNKETRFGTFIFGPVVMRAFYYLNEPDVALNMFKHPELQSFFDQLTTYQVLMCLLYKNGRYSDIIDVFEIVKHRCATQTQYPRNVIILLFGALHQQNTQEALSYGLNIWKVLIERSTIIPRRAITFLAHLAIKQGVPHIALEIITSIREIRYIDARCLKILAYADLKKFTEIIPILRWSLESDKPNLRKEYYFADVIDKLEEALRNSGEEQEELEDIIKRLKQNDFIINKSLELHVCTEIDIVTTNTHQQRLYGSRPILGVGSKQRNSLRELI